MNLTKKLLSYVFPLTRRIQSEFSGELEVTVWNGRKVLDSGKANYSYGSLQRILKFALGKVDFTRVRTVLLLGLGGGSAVDTLTLDFNFRGQITAVDIDPVVIRIAQEEFGIMESDHLEIVCADAFAYVQQHVQAHDLVIIDLFIDNEVPPQFLTAEFWQHVQRNCAPGAQLVFNTIAETTDPAVVKRRLEALGFAVQEHAGVEQTNTVLVAQHPQ